jgi:hypothetical protein
MSDAQFMTVVVAVLAVAMFLSMVGFYTLARDAYRLYRRWKAMR